MKIALLLPPLLLSVWIAAPVAAAPQQQRAKTQQAGQQTRGDAKREAKRDAKRPPKDAAERKQTGKPTGKQATGKPAAGRPAAALKLDPRGASHKMTAEYRTHRTRLARIDALIATFGKKGEREKVERAKAILVREKNRHQKMMDGYKRVLGAPNYDRLLSQLEGRVSRNPVEGEPTRPLRIDDARKKKVEKTERKPQKRDGKDG